MALPISVSVSIPGQHLDKGLTDLLMLAVGPGLTELGALVGDAVGLLRDPVTAFRSANQKRIATGALQQLDLNGVDMDNARQLPMRETIAIVQGISDVDEPKLSELWSGLIASARDPNATQTPDRSYYNTINTLSEADAALFEAIVLTQRLIPIESRLFGPGGFLAGPISILSELSATEIEERRSKFAAKHEEIMGPQLNRVRDLVSSIGPQEARRASADNLLRHRLVEPLKVREFFPTPSRRKEASYQDLISALDARQREERNRATMAVDFTINSNSGALSLAVATTPWGNRFAEACQISLDRQWLSNVENMRKTAPDVPQE